MNLRIYTCAIDPGARETVLALCSCLKRHSKYTINFRWVDGFEFYPIADSAMCAIVGTSTSEEGARTERFFCEKIRAIGIPLLAIEDAVGNYNYSASSGQMPDVVIVQNINNNLLSLKSNALNYFEIWNGALVRYQSRESIAGRHLILPEENKECLWIGQPESGRNLELIINYFDQICNSNLDILFRAHPRDESYALGRYIAIFEKYKSRITDVTLCESEEIVKKRPFVSLSETSSFSIFMYFHGTTPVYLKNPKSDFLASVVKNYTCVENMNDYLYTCKPEEVRNTLMSIMSNLKEREKKWCRFKYKYKWDENDEINLIIQFEKYLSIKLRE